jgi:hypothetical protein
MGGSSSLFSYYLASKGINVTTIDLQNDLVENANQVAEQMKWPLKNLVMDMKELNFPCLFDHITSVCVYEHIPMYDRVEINKSIKKTLKYKGHFSITFDYRNPSKAANINSPDDVIAQFITPSGLSIRGNASFFDNGKNYLLNPFFSEKTLGYKQQAVELGHFDKSMLGVIKTENDYTFGSLFLHKEDTGGNVLAQ